MKRLAIILVLLSGCAGNNAEYIGQEYVGAKYQADALGEAVAPDTDPLIRTDAFDCVTFVETVLANGNREKLNKIRYKNGNIDFLNRNHFIETDWLKNNSDLVENVSSEYAPTKNRHVIIDKQNWLRVVHNLESDFAPQFADLEYIPYEYVSGVHVSEPMIVLFISGKSEKSDKIGTDLAVGHMGFLLPDGVLRHASSQYGCVMDTDFYEYASKRMENKNNIGIMLVKIK